MIKATLVAIGVSAAIAVPAQATTLTLYDGARGTTPGSQNWAAVIPFGASQTVSNNSTILNTTSSNILRGGYTRTAPFSLNRTTGYTLGFNLQLLSEAHSSFHRAGFSVIALGSDLRGIELGFWTGDTQSSDRIWAQNDGATKPPRFTHAEGTNFNPASQMVRYDLSVLGDRYSLFANQNFQAPILTGRLRNYSPEGFPYTVPNFLFFGDNTSSARASVRISRIDLRNSAIPSTSTRRAATKTVSVPEPFTILGSSAAIGIASLIHRKRKKS